MTTQVQFVRKSSNAKIGAIPCTTSASSTCPDACPLKSNGCYASAGYYTRLNWQKVDSGERGGSFADLCASVAKLPEGQLWRHNVAGDLQGADNVIDPVSLADLVRANTGKRGFTYTHYPVDHEGNKEAIVAANTGGFTVNVSCDTPEAAKATREATGLPVVTLVPSEDYWQGKPSVDSVVRCPAEYRDEVTCDTCRLCSVATRATIVGFTAHGSQSKAVTLIASGG